MSATHPFLRLLALLGTALVLVTPNDVSAVELSTVVSSINQVGGTGGVSLGHVAIGRTNYNRITVSGTYNAICANPSMVPVQGQRTLAADNLTGGLTLATTIPQTVPTVVFMPGFEFLPAGTILACGYNWTSKAVEGGYTIGAGGITFQTGNGERTNGSTVPFVMIVPAASDGDGGGDCHP